MGLIPTGLASPVMCSYGQGRMMTEGHFFLSAHKKKKINPREGENRNAHLEVDGPFKSQPLPLECTSRLTVCVCAFHHGAHSAFVLLSPHSEVLQTMTNLPICCRSLVDGKIPLLFIVEQRLSSALLSPPIPYPNNICLPRFLGWC